MFEGVIAKLLSEEIQPEDVTKWLGSSKTPADVFHGCNRVDFANFFLAFLREQACVLESKLAKTPSNTPVKGVKLDATAAAPRKSVSSAPQRRPCSRKLPLGADQSEGRRQHTRPGPQGLTLANFIVPAKPQRDRRNTKPSPKLDSAEEFPEIGKPKRRIQTLLVAPPAQSNKVEISAPKENPFTAAVEVEATETAVDRTILRLECLQFQSALGGEDEQSLRQLGALAAVYASILSNALVINVLSELYFILELLCVPVATDDERPQLLGSSGRCRHFAGRTLGGLRGVFEHLDATTVRMLSENPVLETSNPELVGRLRRMVPNLQPTSLVQLGSVFGLQVDNESKKNFSTPDSFQVYRRQRDSFYALLEDWDSERQFTKPLVRETGAIFEHQPLEPENLAFFSRLFVAQLICSCVGDGHNGVGKTPFELHVDPERLKRLHERLVTPARAQSGPCPQPDFSGWEEFFRDFIVIAASAAFNQHLQDALVSRLKELDEQQFCATELQPKVLVVEDETKIRYLACVVSAQLVAKFLAFVQFNCYRPVTLGKRLSEQSVIAQVVLRENVNPALETSTHLMNAEQRGRLMLTVPWLCSYVVQLDAVSLRLPVSQATIAGLIAVLRSLPSQQLPGSAGLLLRLSIGWCLSNITELWPGVWAVFRNSSNSRPTPMKSSDCLDDLELVDARALALLCPYVLELRTVLTGASSNSKAGQNLGPRHITPVAAALSGDPELQLELQLEASFIQTQPSAVRQTVEFITERLTTLCTSHLQESVVVSETRAQEAQLLERVQAEGARMPTGLSFSETVSTLKRNLEPWTVGAADEQLRQMVDRCVEAGGEFVAGRCGQLLSQLLPAAVSSIQCDAFAQIICKNVRDKIRAWLHATYGQSELLKKLREGVEKASKQWARTGADHPLTQKSELQLSLRLPLERQGVAHDSNVICPADLLLNFRELILRLNGGQKVSVAEVEALLESTGAVLAHREDLIPVAHGMLRPLSLDLAISLVVFCPGKASDAAAAGLVRLWDGVLGRPEQLERLLCPRHLHLMESSPCPQESWDAFTRFLQRLVAAGLASPASFEEQAVAVFQQPWSSSFLSHFASCIDAVARASAVPSDSEEFSQMLPWLADYCADLDNLPPDE